MNPVNRPSVIIIGASVRAAAASAFRAGFAPIAIDLFQDLDLQEIATTLVWPPDSDVLKTYCQKAAGWMYVGGAENWSSLWQTLAHREGPLHDLPLWSNPVSVVNCVKRSQEIAQWSVEAGCRPIPTATNANEWNFDNPALCKPLQGAGGQGIGRYVRGTSIPEGYVVQAEIPGDACSTVCLSDGTECQVLGHTAQLIGCVSSHSPGEWSYCGNVAPVPIDRDNTECLHRFAQLVTRDTGIRGLWGFDFLKNDQGVFVCEINPRYTASIELLEWSLGLPLFDWHVRACQKRLAPKDWSFLSATVESKCHCERVWGKQILYSNREMTVLEEWFPVWHGPTDAASVVADIPAVGQRIGKGEPICTVYATASNPEDCRVALMQAVESWYARMAHLCEPGTIPRVD